MDAFLIPGSFCFLSSASPVQISLVSVFFYLSELSPGVFHLPNYLVCVLSPTCQDAAAGKLDVHSRVLW